MIQPPMHVMAPRFAALANVVYLVTFSGSYYTNSGTASDNIKGFEPIVIRMTQRMVNEGPLSVFKNEIAPQIFAVKYPDFKMLHKWRVDAATREDGQPVVDLNLMNRGEITSVIVRENLPIRPSLYKNVDDLKEAFIRFLQDQHGFEREQDFRKRTLNQTAKIAADLQELNPELFSLVQAANEAELQNKIVNQPSLFDVIATKNAIDSMQASGAFLADEINSTGIPLHAMQGQRVRGVVENAMNDEFLDGVPTINGKPINNPLGTKPPVQQFQQPRGF